MRLPLRTFFPYALPGLLAFFGLWWFTTRKKNHAGKQAKHACAKEEDTAAAKRSGLVEEIDPNTQASLSNHGECEEVSIVWGGHTKLSLPVESVGVLDQSCRLSCSTVSTEETAFEKEEKFTLESTPSPDSDNVCAGEANYSLITEQEQCSVSEMLTDSFDPLQFAHHLKLNEQDQDSVPELLDREKTEFLSAVLQEEVYYPAVQKMDHENIPELPETENVLLSAGSSEVLHTVLKEREQSSVVEMTEMEKGVEPSISLQQQMLHVVSVSEEQTGDDDMLECEAYLHSSNPLLQEAAHHPTLNDQKQGSVTHLVESEKPGQYQSPLQDSMLQHTMFNDEEQDNILESLILKPFPLYQNAASHIIEKGKVCDLGLSDLQKSVQTSCVLQDESCTILNEAKENSVLELPDSDKTHCTSILFQQKSLHLAKDCDLGVSGTSKSLDSEKIPHPPCLLFQKAAYHEESSKLELSSAFQSESENVQHSSGALQEQTSFPSVVVAQEQTSGLELVESENFPSLCSLRNATHQSVPVPELLPSEKNIQSCSVLHQEAAYPVMADDQVQSFVESLESCETEHSSKVLQQDAFPHTKLANLTDSGILEIGPEATLHPSISSQVTVQPTLSEQEQSSDCQSEETEKILRLALPQLNAVQDTLHEQEQNRIPEMSGPEKMLMCSCHMEDAHYTGLTEQEQIASDEILQLENGFCFSSQLQSSTVTKHALLSNLELCDSSGKAQEMEGNSNSAFAEKPKSLDAVPTDIHCPCTEAAPIPENEVVAAVLASPTVEKITGPVEVHESLANTGKIAVEKTLTSVEAGSHEFLETKFNLGTSVTCNELCAENFELLNNEENITLDMVIEESSMKAINRVASDLVSKIIEAAVHEILSSVDHKTEMHPIKTDMKVEQVVCRLEIGEVDTVLHGKTSTLVKRVEDLKVEIENSLILDSSSVKAPPNESEYCKQKVDTVECSGNEYSDEADMKNHSADFSVQHRLCEVGHYCAETVKDVPESTSLIAEDSGCSTCTSEDGMCSEDPLQSTPLSSVLVDVLGESVIKEVLGVKDVEPATVKQTIRAEVEHDISYSKEAVARNYVTKNESQWSAEVDNSGGSDVNSMDSGDSGCGLSGSEHHLSQHTSLNSNKSEFTVWEIEVPKHLVGRLIGKQGRYVSYLKQISGAKIYITTVPYTQEFQICHIEGSQQQVDKALSLIGEKFRELDLINIYAPQRSLTLPSLPMTSWLSLPEGVTVEVIVVSVISAGHVFVQQHTHPTFHALRCLDHQMRLCYSQPGIPAMPAPVVGVICAAPAADGAWWRAQVVAYYKESNEADIRYVDYGGYEKVQLEALRQIRSDFVTLPFQGVEVLLDNIAPLPGEDHFLSEADTALVEMTRGCSLLAQVTNYESSSGLPLIQLWNIMGDEVMSVNRTLVERGLAQWIDSY
ncbi:uncharacterized protein LOC122787746 [Protopterus annectens]|uniref:uncharacterized protein LOC122787746 n=1 Tax=Protopterus annectens TaxID=7888 RepID=UPI001CFA0EB1|nr:uncharacterized protein LOC122787746 [Protopterus annectens]XP_043910570.1 uncharacterized protein LOC122787746 [Protopterus annectens]